MKFGWVRFLHILSSAAILGCGDPASVRIAVAMGGDGNAAAQVAMRELERRAITDIDIEVVSGAPGISSLSLSALEIAHRLVDDPTVLAVVGHSNSEASLAASAVYNHAGVVQIAPTSTATEFHEAGEYSFRLVPDDGRQAEFILQQISGETPSRIAVVFVNDEYGRSLYYQIRDGLKATRHELVREGAYVAGADSAQMGRIGRNVAAAQADILLWLGRAPELAPVLESLWTANPGIDVYAGDGVDTPEVYANVDGRYTGLTFVRLIDVDAASRRGPGFAAGYRKLMNRAPSAEAVLTYDAIMLLVSAIRSGARDRRLVRERVADFGRTLPAYEGISGPVGFDADGDVVRPHHLARVTSAGVRAARSGAAPDR